MQLVERFDSSQLTAATVMISSAKAPTFEQLAQTRITITETDKTAKRYPPAHSSASAVKKVSRLLPMYVCQSAYAIDFFTVYFTIAFFMTLTHHLLRHNRTVDT